MRLLWRSLPEKAVPPDDPYPDQLKETTMNPDTRRLIEMRLADAERDSVHGVFKLLMAKGEAAGRRAWMEEKGHLIEADL